MKSWMVTLTLVETSSGTHLLPVSLHLIGEGGGPPLLATALTVLCTLNEISQYTKMDCSQLNEWTVVTQYKLIQELFPTSSDYMVLILNSAFLNLTKWRNMCETTEFGLFFHLNSHNNTNYDLCPIDLWFFFSIQRHVDRSSSHITTTLPEFLKCNERFRLYGIHWHRIAVPFTWLLIAVYHRSSYQGKPWTGE